jgi:hypothetical protein
MVSSRPDPVRVTRSALKGNAPIADQNIITLATVESFISIAVTSLLPPKIKSSPGLAVKSSHHEPR